MRRSRARPAISWRDTLRRLTLALGKTEEDYLRWCAGSFLVSADNAHAQHPNHPEFADAQNTPYLNGGVVVKFNANQRYATDAVSAAAFRLLCRETGEQTQTYANRSDLPAARRSGRSPTRASPCRRWISGWHSWRCTRPMRRWVRAIWTASCA